MYGTSDQEGSTVSRSEVRGEVSRVDEERERLVREDKALEEQREQERGVEAQGGRKVEAQVKHEEEESEQRERNALK